MTRNSVSPEANLGRETQFCLALGQPRMGDAVLSRQVQLWAGDAIPSRPRPTSDGRRCSASPETNLGWETLLQLARSRL
jgi:hypothetical protein